MYHTHINISPILLKCMQWKIFTFYHHLTFFLCINQAIFSEHFLRLNTIETIAILKRQSIPLTLQFSYHYTSSTIARVTIARFNRVSRPWCSGYVTRLVPRCPKFDPSSPSLSDETLKLWPSLLRRLKLPGKTTKP